jgi:hypothetical protein
MKRRWLNLILHLTSSIHSKKQKLVMSTVFSAMNLALQIIGLELLLFLISLPTYFFIKEDFSLVTEHNQREIASYRMRQKFIVSLVIILGFILLAWFAVHATIRVFFAPMGAVS